MAGDWAAKTAAEIDRSFGQFMDNGQKTGEISYLVGGHDHIDAGVFRVRPGEHPDRTPVPHVFERDEYLWVIEGQVHVEANDMSMTLREGDCAFFPSGHKGTWTFEAPFRKFSVEIARGGEEQ